MMCTGCQHNHGHGLKLPGCLATLVSGVFWGALQGSAIKELQMCRIGALVWDFGAVNLYADPGPPSPCTGLSFLRGTGNPESSEAHHIGDKSCIHVACFSWEG